MFRTVQSFFFLWAIVQAFLGFIIRQISPMSKDLIHARAHGGQIAFWLMIQAFTGFILLVAFILTQKGFLDLLGALIIDSWGF